MGRVGIIERNACSTGFLLKDLKVLNKSLCNASPRRCSLRVRATGPQVNPSWSSMPLASNSHRGATRRVVVRRLLTWLWRLWWRSSFGHGLRRSDRPPR